MHRDQFDKRCKLRVMRIPIDTSRSLAIANMVWLRQCIDALFSQILQLPMQVLKARGIQNFSSEIFIDDIAITSRREMDFESRKDHKATFFIFSLQGLHHLWPNVLQSIETI